MQYYEAYEDVLDEDYGDAYDDAYDEAYDDSYGDAYDDAADESSDEEFGEGRGRRGGRRRRGVAQRPRPRRGGKRPHGKPKQPQPAKTEDVKTAFKNVKLDLEKIHRELEKEKTRQANEQINDLIATYLFRPRLTSSKGEDIPIKLASVPVTITVTPDPTPTPVVAKGVKPLGDQGTVTLVAAEATAMQDAVLAAITPKVTLATTESTVNVPTTVYALEDNLLPLMAVKLLSNMKGIDTAKGIERYLPLAAGLLLSSSAQKDLGIGDGKSTGNTAFKGLTDKPLLMIGLLLLAVNWSKFSKK